MVVVLSRFRVANGMEPEVARAFRQRPRAVEQAPGFLWLEVFVDRADPAVFYLLTRWTDLQSFERWHDSPAHRESPALIPKGLRLDPAWTQVFTLDRLERPRAVVERQLQQMNRLVEGLADTARVAAGDVELRRGRLDLVHQLRELATAWEATAQAQHKSFICRLPGTPLELWADQDLLQQVFSNLVGNAFKYTPPGAAVTLDLRSESGAAVVSVRDEGEGIPAERLPRIFELFQRATNTGSGLGVGLAVVHALVHAHGGTVAAESEGLGRGATFVVRLPLARE